MSELFCDIDEFLNNVSQSTSKELVTASSCDITSSCDIICLATDDDNEVTKKQIEKIATILIKKQDTRSAACSSSNQNSFVTIVQNKNIAFPQILHAMLRTSTENGYGKIFSWQHHGRS